MSTTKSRRLNAMVACICATVLALTLALPSTSAFAVPASADYLAAYTPIIKAYADMEKSGYTTYDKNVIGDNVLAGAIDGRYAKAGDYMSGTPYTFTVGTKLVYAICDLSGDGVPELVIAAQYLKPYSEKTYNIMGIYTCTSNKAVLAKRPINGNYPLEVLTDYTIYDWWSRLDWMAEAFSHLSLDGTRAVEDDAYSFDFTKFNGTTSSIKITRSSKTISLSAYKAAVSKYPTNLLEWYAVKLKTVPPRLNFTWTPLATPIPASTPATIFSGISRSDTAAKVALDGYASGAKGVILTAGSGSGQTGKFADALAASSLAGILNYPILLTEPGSLPYRTETAIKTLNPQEIIILGDNNSVSQAVRNQLSTISSAKIIPIAGANRIQTAVNIYNYGLSVGGAKKSDTAIFAYSGNFPDALAISPYAAASNTPIFLVDGASLNEAVKNAITNGNFKRAIIVGSNKDAKGNNLPNNKCVSGSIENEINSIITASGPAVRLGGVNRYATAKLIADYSVTNLGLSYNNAGIATAENFPDALAGGPFLGKHGAVLLLAKDSDKSTLDLLNGKSGISKLHILGGESAVSKNVHRTIESKLGWSNETIK